MVKTRIMTYNILDGGAGRLDQISSVVRRVEPDILIVNEANGFEENNFQVANEFSRKVKLPYFHIELGGDGWGYHVAVFSKYEIVSIRPIEGASRAIVLVKFDELKSVSIIGLHLSPFTEDQRLAEARRLFDVIGEKPRCVIVAGDFNSLSKLDAQASGLANSIREASMEDKFMREGKPTYDLYEMFATNGLQAATDKRQNTVPTSIRRGHPPVSLDRILVSEDIRTRVLDYKVVKDQITDIASDHFPIYADINV